MRGDLTDFAGRTLGVGVALQRSVWMIGMLALVGCAASSPGTRLLRDGDPAGAADLLREETAQSPADAALRRNLGVALWQTGDLPASIITLEEARALDPENAQTYFFLGQVSAEAGRPQEAVGAYAEYLARTERGEPVVRRMIQDLSGEIARGEIRAAIDEEERLSPESVPANTVAVPPFTNVSNSERLAPLSRGLASVMVTDLSQVGDLRVLERNRIQHLLEELRLTGQPAAPATEGEANELAASLEGVVDGREELASGTAPRVGLLLGVRTFAQGAFAVTDESRIQLDAFLIEISGEVRKSAGEPVSGAVEEALGLEKKLVYQALDALGVVPTDEERRRIGRIPTENFEAFLAYSRGLEHEDEGRPQEAVLAYREALQLDPGFQEARERDDVATVAAGDVEMLSDAVREEAISEPDVDGEDLEDRVTQTGTETGGVTPPESDDVAGGAPSGQTDPPAPIKVDSTPPPLPDFPDPPPAAGGVRP